MLRYIVSASWVSDTSSPYLCSRRQSAIEWWLFWMPGSENIIIFAFSSYTPWSHTRCFRPVAQYEKCEKAWGLSNIEWRNLWALNGCPTIVMASSARSKNRKSKRSLSSPKASVCMAMCLACLTCMCWKCATSSFYHFSLRAILCRPLKATSSHPIWSSRLRCRVPPAASNYRGARHRAGAVGPSNKSPFLWSDINDVDDAIVSVDSST